MVGWEIFGREERLKNYLQKQVYRPIKDGGDISPIEGLRKNVSTRSKTPDIDDQAELVEWLFEAPEYTLHLSISVFFSAHFLALYNGMNYYRPSLLLLARCKKK